MGRKVDNFMDLSKKERLFLYNQYEILKRLNNDDPDTVKDYELNQEILLNGYKHEYESFFTWIDDDTPNNVSEFVWDVFDMYRALYGSYHQLTTEQKDQIDLRGITFQGYDGNEESDYYSYSNFILEKMGRYEEIYNKGKVELNSHRNMAATYQNMIRTWERIRDGEYSQLTVGQILEVVNSRY
jgi:uncharacterized protein YfbU (UPF0304 family)